uniref:Uncharacterized protein TCIL3000_8_7750 n=1 Tax=Trypanosoma congolense (strain IL3000) TaxID=1068625 RepID=G0UT32_TRYCI|nr:unnamed protein product [Trypanosoma congolense IL3000]
MTPLDTTNASQSLMNSWAGMPKKINEAIIVVIASLISLLFLGVSIAFCILRINLSVRQLFYNRSTRIEALAPSHPVVEYMRQKALEGQVAGAAMIDERNRELIDTATAPLTPVHSFCEDCKEMSRVASNASTVDIAVNAECLSANEHFSDAAMSEITFRTKCRLHYPKKIRDLTTNNVFRLYVSRNAAHIYGSAAYTTNDGNGDAKEFSPPNDPF